MLLSILKKAVPVPKLTSFDNYLFVGPHPDDIEVGCGGTVAELVALGKKVSFVVVTDGCVGSLDQTLTEEEIVPLRQKEALESAHLLGVNDVTFLPFNDGKSGEQLSQITASLVKILVDKKPDVVFCPDHTVRSECHADHLNVGKATTDACLACMWDKMTARVGVSGHTQSPVISYYYTDKPNSFVNVTKTCQKHMDAIHCHKSQFTESDFKNLALYFKLREIRFGFKCGKRRAEGFRTLSQTHQHCFPEASLF